MRTSSGRSRGHRYAAYETGHTGGYGPEPVALCGKHLDDLSRFVANKVNTALAPLIEQEISISDPWEYIPSGRPSTCGNPCNVNASASQRSAKMAIGSHFIALQGVLSKSGKVVNLGNTGGNTIENYDDCKLTVTAY